MTINSWVRRRLFYLELSTTNKQRVLSGVRCNVQASVFFETFNKPLTVRVCSLTYAAFCHELTAGGSSGRQKKMDPGRNGCGLRTVGRWQ